MNGYCCPFLFVCLSVGMSQSGSGRHDRTGAIQHNEKYMQLRFYRQCYLCGFVNFNLFYVIKFKLNLLFDWSFSFQLYTPERKEELGTASGIAHAEWVKLLKSIKWNARSLALDFAICNVQFIKWKLQLEFDIDSYQRAFIYKWCCCSQIRRIYIRYKYIYTVNFTERERKRVMAQSTAHGDFNWFQSIDTFTAC